MMEPTDLRMNRPKPKRPESTALRQDVRVRQKPAAASKRPGPPPMS